MSRESLQHAQIKAQVNQNIHFVLLRKYLLEDFKQK